jgi:hypothetical protein
MNIIVKGDECGVGKEVERDILQNRASTVCFTVLRHFLKLLQSHLIPELGVFQSIGNFFLILIPTNTRVIINTAPIII